MKKFILVLILVLTLNVSASAANSDDIYVRKDVFDVHLQNINSKLELILSEMQSFKAELQAQRNDINELAKVTAVLSSRIDGLDARIDGTNTRIDDLRNGLYLWLVVITAFISFLGVIVAWPRVKDFFTAQRHTLSIQDVEILVTKIIDAKLNSKAHE